MYYGDRSIDTTSATGINYFRFFKTCFLISHSYLFASSKTNFFGNLLCYNFCNWSWFKGFKNLNNCKFLKYLFLNSFKSLNLCLLSQAMMKHLAVHFIATSVRNTVNNCLLLSWTVWMFTFYLGKHWKLLESFELMEIFTKCVVIHLLLSP